MEKVEIDNTIVKLLLEWKKTSVWIDYDKDIDVMYISFEKPQKADDSILSDDGKIYHYRKDMIVGITIPNASKVSTQKDWY
jgi:uncharacterized protein YuzE